MKRLLFLALLLLPASVQAQQVFMVKCNDGTTSFWCADSVNTALRVNCVVGCSAAASFADNSAFTFGTTAISNTGFVVDDVATNAVAENSAGAPRMSGQRIPYFSLHTDAGTALLGQTTKAGSIPVTLASDQGNAALTTTGTISAACADPCASPETANSTVKLALGDTAGGVSIDFLSSTLVATLKCDESRDGTNWIIATCLNLTTADRGLITNPTALVPFTVNVTPGAGFVRVRASAVTSGTASVYLRVNNVKEYDSSLPFTTWPNLATKPGATQVSQRVVNLGGGDGTTGCNSFPCAVQSVWLNTPPVGTERGLLTREAGLDVATAATVLNSACADPCQGALQAGTLEIQMAGKGGVQAHLTATSAATLTIKFEVSYDHNDWTTVNAWDLGTFSRGASFANPAGAPKDYSIMYREGSRYVRVRISAYTSGSVTFMLAANTVAATNTNAFTSAAGIQVPPSGLHLLVDDNSTACNSAACGRNVIATNALPVGTEYMVLGRNIVQGSSASGAAKAGAPVQVGGVFNTVQPTVTTGQTVEAQATARGALIVAPGVDNTAANAWFTKVTDGTTTAAVIASTTALKTDMSSVAGTATVTAAAGVQKVGVIGNANAAFDAANNAAAPANVLAMGAQLQSGATATAGTAGQVGTPVAGLDHVLYSRFGGPVTWSNFKDAITVTTEVRAAPAAGIKAYVTSIACSNQAATVQTIDVVFGTGANCATGTTALSHKFQFGTNATTTSPFVVTHTFASPLVPTAANAVCVRPSAATAFGCTLTGYDAP